MLKIRAVKVVSLAMNHPVVSENRFSWKTFFLYNCLQVKDKRGTAATHINAIARVLAVESKDPERVRGFVEFLLEKKFVPASPSEFVQGVLLEEP